MKLHPKQEIIVTRLLMAVTILAGLMFSFEIITQIALSLQEKNVIALAQQTLFILIVFFLIYGNILYQLTRIGYFTRLMRHKHASTSELVAFAYNNTAPQVTILVPSYKENISTVRQTLLSAALQEYPNKRIVLLIDDPHHPQTYEDSHSLQAIRKLPVDLHFIFQTEAQRYQTALEGFLKRQSKGIFSYKTEKETIVGLYTNVITWLEHSISLHSPNDQEEKLLIEKVFQKLATAHIARREKLQKLPVSAFSDTFILHEYKRLATLFVMEITYFERRAYANLSHEPNKAANLNSYMSLLGKSFKQTKMDNGTLYLSEKTSKPTLVVPQADYVLTLDADSILLPEYVLRLVHFMEQKQNEKVAVVQTPYSANPRVVSPIERLAGATTDIQYIIHQGFTHYNATFWVGANALIRKKALDDIAEIERYGNFNIIRYIQDRTVIEDTESTIDLVDKGWQLYNYPARLAHSATPPDFGSLLIQRRRWANGGFIILPKLLKYLFLKPYRRGKFREGFMRFHYLTSIGFVSLGILLLLLVPFGDSAYSYWLPLTAIPYYMLYARDLTLCGYKLGDIFRVYAFNLMLIPINLGGFFKSLQQGITGKKIPFGRTPKVANRTAAPALYVWAEYMLLLYCLFAFGMDIYHQYYTHAIYSAINALFFVYILTKYIGWSESMEDIKSAFAR